MPDDVKTDESEIVLYQSRLKLKRKSKKKKHIALIAHGPLMQIL
jgi:hypothetical protein